MEHQKFISSVGHEIIIVKNRITGGYQGYVGIDRDHPLFGKSYGDKIDLVEEDEKKNSEEWIESRGSFNLFLDMFSKNDPGKITLAMQFSVHGGITYSGFDYWDRSKKTVRMTGEIKKYVKTVKLMQWTGNELYSHYSRMGINIHKYRNLAEDREEWKLKAALINPDSIGEHEMFPAAWRAHTVYERLRDRPVPKNVTLKDGSTCENFSLGLDKKTFKPVFYIGNDSKWYFGWDCAHYRDVASDFTVERARMECDRLSEQLFFYGTLKSK